MGIFTKPDFERAEREGRLVVKNGRHFGATSVDIRVKKLFKQPRILVPPFDDLEYLLDASTDRFLESLLEVPLEKEGEDSYWLLKPDELYFFLAEEEVYKKNENFLSAKIVTRSSWARFGVRVNETDDNLTCVNREFDDKIVGLMKTRNTTVKLRPGDAPAQLIAGHFGSPVLTKEMAKLIARGIFMIQRDGAEGMDIDLTYEPTQGITLTLDRKINVYNGGVIDPRRPINSYFKEIELDEKGMYIEKGEFFISSSKEWISICNCYLGWVWHNQYFESPEGANPIEAHPNAPMIQPSRIFEGKITLENHPGFAGQHITPGMPIANLNLVRLESTLLQGKKSRYNWQDDATLSRKDS